MKYFKNENNKVFAYEDDVKEEVLNGFIEKFGLTSITEAEFKTLTAPSLKDLQNKKLSDMATTYQTESTKDVPYKDVLYKGGDASASAIAGAVELAQSLQETEVKIIGSDDKPNIMSFSEALELSGLIAKAWRTAFFRYKELKVQISNAATVEELESISWEEV